MCEDIMERVAGYHLSAESGVLKGFLRRCIEGELYPGIIPRADAEVAGIVYMNVSEDAWRRLDAFEGALYERRGVLITMPGGDLDADTYVVKPEFTYRLSREEWRFEDFLRDGKSTFIRSYGGYGEIGSV